MAEGLRGFILITSVDGIPRCAMGAAHLFLAGCESFVSEFRHIDPLQLELTRDLHAFFDELLREALFSFTQHISPLRYSLGFSCDRFGLSIVTGFGVPRNQRIS
jgi:hypothetical protein